MSRSVRSLTEDPAAAVMTPPACPPQRGRMPALRRLGSVRAAPVACTLALTIAVLLSACSSAPPVGPGFYRVTRGDNLSSIAQRNGRSTAEIARWNSIDNPDRIEVGQVLRIDPPPGSVDTSAPSPSVWRTSPPARAAESPSRATAAPKARVATPPPPPPAKCGPVALRLPAAGPVLGSFDGRRNKGIDIGGNNGTPIVAAATGQVAFVGQLRGYGNLLIIKHSNGYLTSYAHLMRATVREGQTVNAGQTIAQMGQTESSRPMLHFELRCNGVPVDPQHFLPGK